MPKLMFACLIVGVVWLSISASHKNVNSAKHQTATLRINNCSIEVEIADTPALRIRGLSGRKTLAENRGMFFVMEKPLYYRIWMKDMNFALDIIWLLDLKVVEITPGIPPPSLLQLDQPQYHPSSPVNHVLEVNAGVAEKCGLKIGDTISFIR
jgi:uncharacterized membrane protein (UPF0127 family)